jgi:CBS domain containing-hemolysin-like protein
VVDLVLSTARVLAALFLVALNGFFVAAEFAFVRIRSSSVDRLVGDGAPGAETLAEAVENLDDYLAVTQLGITIASLGLGWIGEPAVAALIEPVLAPLLPSSVLHLVAFAIGFGVITFLHVVFGELAPKTVAIARAERIALLVAPPMKLFYYLFWPGLVVSNGPANYSTRLVGIPPASETDETLTEEEILTVLTRSGRRGHVDKREVEMIERVFELDDLAVREVMVPRPDAVTVPADHQLPGLTERILEAKHTRYPVLDAEDGDRVVGYVDVKDVLAAGEQADAADVTAGDLARDLPVVPETGRVDGLLAEFQAEERQMAAVVDEWGAFEGIATVEDVVEEIVGELRDEFDVAAREPTIEPRGDGRWVVDGGVAVSQLNDAVGTDVERDEFGTVGGLVLDRLGRAPAVGDSVAVDGYRLDVEEVDGARVARVALREEPAGRER